MGLRDRGCGRCNSPCLVASAACRLLRNVRNVHRRLLSSGCTPNIQAATTDRRAGARFDFAVGFTAGPTRPVRDQSNELCTKSL